MTSDSTPAFEIEKEALKTEIETGIQAGVDHLEAKTAKRKDADKYHNTRHLLKQYRKVAYGARFGNRRNAIRLGGRHSTSPNRVCKFCQRSNSFGGQPCVRLGKFDCTHFGAHRSMELYQASIRGSGEIHSRRRSDLHSSSRIRYRGIRKHIKCL